MDYPLPLSDQQPKTPHLTSFHLFIAVTVLLGSMLLGGLQINQSGFWHDEASSIGFITDSAHWYTIAPEQMPVYYLVLRPWTELVGTSEVAGRWLSLLLGLLTLAISFRLASRYFSPRIAVVSLIILGSSAFFVRYFREMRPYMLLAFACMLSMWFFLEWITKQRYYAAILYLIVSITAIYTHYFAGLIIAVQGLYFLWVAKPVVVLPKPILRFNRFVMITLGLFVCIALSLIPYLQFYFSGLHYVTSGGYSVFALTPSQALDSSVLTLTNDSLALFLILILLAIVSRAKGLSLGLLWAFFPLGLALFVNAFVYRMFANPRYVIFIWPAFAIVSAIGLCSLPRRVMAIMIGVLIFIGVGQVYNDLPSTLPGVLNNPPWREMFSTISPRTKLDSRILVNMVDLVGLTSYRVPMLYYFGQYMPEGFSAPIELDFPPQPSTDDVQQIAQHAQEIWFIATDGRSNARGDAAINMIKQSQYVQCRQWEYPQQRTYLSQWEHVAGDTYNFDNGLRLQKQPLNTIKEIVSAGDVLDVYLGLSTTSQLPIDYSLGIYLFDESGHVVAQEDGSLANSRTSSWITNTNYCDVRSMAVPKTPGTYSVKLAVYDSESGRRLAPQPSTTPDNLIEMFSITAK